MFREHFISRDIAIIYTLAVILVFFTACSSKQRYIPVVKYQQPSLSALHKILRGTYGDSYRYAGQGPNRFDCSGLVYYSFATMNLWLPRKSIDQSKRGKTIPIDRLKYGDLIFFDTRKRFRGEVNHVGIYIGNGNFIHASSSKRGVIRTSLNKPFYQKRVIICKRVIL
ncbi:MAG: C40 family peptidase [Campylobacterota bacterium]|nr:C40 family peptidase [Campylobacterota bacterium]